MTSKLDLQAAFEKATHGLTDEKAEYLLNVIVVEAGRLAARAAAERAAMLLRAVPIYVDRQDTRQTAIEFFHLNYDGIVASGEVFADDLRRHDTRLYDALAVHQNARGRKLSDLVPARPNPLRSGRPRKAKPGSNAPADVAA
jgi:hypothetical protein